MQDEDELTGSLKVLATSNSVRIIIEMQRMNKQSRYYLQDLNNLQKQTLTKGHKMSKKDKIIIVVLAILGLGLLIIDGKLGETTCGENNYNQTTGFCQER